MSYALSADLAPVEAPTNQKLYWTIGIGLAAVGGYLLWRGGKKKRYAKNRGSRRTSAPWSRGVSGSWWPTKHQAQEEIRLNQPEGTRSHLKARTRDGKRGYQVWFTRTKHRRR